MNRTKTGLLAAGVIASTVLLAAPAFAVTLTGLSATAAAGVNGRISSLDHPSTASASWTGTPASLSQSTSVSPVGAGGGTLTVSSSVGGTWAADGLSGAASLVTGWDFAEGPDDAYTEADFRGTAYSYTFTNDVAAILNISYDVTGGGNFLFGLSSYNVFVDGFGGNVLPFPTNVFDPNASGALSFNLAAGQSHTLFINTDGNVSSAYLTAAGSQDGEFRFGFSDAPGTVPEPASWALMILGFGSIGALTRRRAAVVSAA